jgi:hypothetical protein
MIKIERSDKIVKPYTDCLQPLSEKVIASAYRHIFLKLKLLILFFVL